MIIKKLEDHVIKQSPTCGEIREILSAGEYDPLDIAVLVDLEPTKAHYHKGFDEIYFVLDGNISVKFYDPQREKTWSELLKANELCIIPKGIHHRIVETSEKNRLCAICLPCWSADDESLSKQL